MAAEVSIGALTYGPELANSLSAPWLEESIPNTIHFMINH